MKDNGGNDVVVILPGSKGWIIWQFGLGYPHNWPLAAVPDDDVRIWLTKTLMV